MSNVISIFAKYYKHTLPLELRFQAKQCFFTSINVFQALLGFLTTSCMCLNSCKSKTCDKKKNIVEWHSCCLGSGFGAMQTNQKYYAVTVETNQATTMWSTGLGCSQWVLVISCFIVWLCSCMDPCESQQTPFFPLTLLWTKTKVVLQTCWSEGWTSSVQINVQTQSKHLGC